MNDSDRTEGGETFPGTKVVATDAIAYLSGVNYGSVVKVLAAMNAIAQFIYEAHFDDMVREGISPEEELEKSLLDFIAVPTTPVQVNNKYCKVRAAETDKFVRALIKEGYAKDYPILAASTARLLGQAEEFKVGLSD